MPLRPAAPSDTRSHLRVCDAGFFPSSSMSDPFHQVIINHPRSEKSERPETSERSESPKTFPTTFPDLERKQFRIFGQGPFLGKRRAELMISKMGCCEFTKRCVIVTVIGQIDSESPPRPGTSQRRKQRRRQRRSLAAPAAEGWRGGRRGRGDRRGRAGRRGRRGRHRAGKRDMPLFHCFT